MSYMLEREKGQLTEVKKLFYYFFFVDCITVAVVAAFPIITVRPHTPLCTWHTLRPTSPKKNKCRRDRRAELPIEKRAQGPRDQDS